MSNQPVCGSEREQWIGILDAAAKRQPDTLNREWEWHLAQLGLPADDFLHIVEALKQGRWRQSKNPRAYLKTVARRESTKARAALAETDPTELLQPHPSDRAFAMDVALGDLHYAMDTSEALKGPGGVWRRGGGLEAHSEEQWLEDDDGNPIGNLRDRLLAHLPAQLKQVEEPSDELKAVYEWLNEGTTDHHYRARISIHPDWSAWSEAAGFDEWERQVLEYRLDGVSRDRAMQRQEDEERRKCLQAAWRRFDRNGMQRLQLAAKKIKTEMSRNGSSATLDK